MKSAEINSTTIASQGSGLATAEAKSRFLRFGPNEPVSSHRTSGLVQILFLFINPLAIILLVASAISAAVGEVINATIIALMVLLSAALNFFQTYRSQRAVERIRKEVAPTATVLRDGSWTEIPRRELVPGDVIDCFLFLAGATITYLLLVEIVKRRLMRRLLK
jgi:Mg2+-importing ATPase